MSPQVSQGPGRLDKQRDVVDSYDEELELEMDLESRRRWEACTRAKEVMLERTHIPDARWWIVEGDDKKRRA
jgi:hypothetical protein